MGTTGRVWLAAAASVCAGTSLVVLASSPLTTNATFSSATQTAVVISSLAVLAAAWLTVSAPLAFGRGAITSLLAITMTAPLLVGWIDGPMIVRVLARLIAPFVIPLVLHLLVTGLSPRTRRTLRSALWASYVATALGAAGILVTRNAFYDVRCWEDCTVPPLIAGLPLVLTGLGSSAEFLITVVGAAIGVAGVSIGLVRRRGIESPSIAFTALGTLIVLTTLSAAAHLHPSIGDPWLTLRADVFVAASVSLTALGVSIGVAAARSSARSRRVERLADELGDVSRPGAVESTFASLLADDSVEVRFPSVPDDRLIDSAGREADFHDAPNRTRVEIRRGGSAIAYLEADAERADLRAITDGFGSAARIAIDNERLRAEILAHLLALRQSRQRIVEAADLQRRRTERDLHDGAQSALVGLLYALSARQRSIGPEWARQDVALLDEATSALRELVAALREIAHGVYPADLASTGLEEAVRSLLDRLPVAASLEFAMSAQPPEPVERLAYFAAKRLLESDPEPIALSFSCTTSALTIRCTGRIVSPGLEDRIAALSGALHVEDDVIVIEIPCE